MAIFNSRQTFGYNKFNRSHRCFASHNLGYVYPIRISEVVPGETLSLNVDAFARMLPFVNPAFADVDLEIAHYYVSRNAIDPFYSIRTAQFQGENKNPYILHTVLTQSTTQNEINVNFGAGSLSDFLGCYIASPDASTLGVSLSINLMPFFAYHMIVDRYYRNPHLSDVERTRKFIRDMFKSYDVPSVTFSALLTEWSALSGSSPAPEDRFFSIERVNWAPDYFTTARPTANGANLSIPGLDPNNLENAFNLLNAGDPTGAAGQISEFSTIPALWDAELMQKVVSMLEHGGYSYFDFMKTLYGVDLNQSDYENEYPVYLGGSSRPLSIDTVNQVAPSSTSENGSGLGIQAGQATAYNSNNGFSRRFSKAGYVISVLVFRPQVAYNGGIASMFRHETLGDDLIPVLADLSDQPIMKSELGGYPGSIDAVFGYTDRYNEHRTMFNRCCGALRWMYSDWVLKRRVTSGTISEQWVEAVPSYDVYQNTDTSVDHFLTRCHIQEEATLPLPYKPRPYVW